MDRRIDHLTALLVDATLNYRAAYGTVHCAHVLADLGVDADTVARVLTQSSRRRHYYAEDEADDA